MKINLGDFNTKTGRKVIFNPTICNEIQHWASNDNDVRIVKLVTSKDRVLNNHNQICYIFIDRRHSSIIYIRSISGPDCDTVHFLLVAKVRERWAVSGRAAQEFHVERFNFRKLNELEVRS